VRDVGLSREQKDRPEKKAGSPGAAVGAFIAYGSAKHLWNKRRGQVHRWRRKTKVFNTRENPQDRVLLLAAGRSYARAVYTYIEE